MKSKRDAEPYIYVYYVDENKAYIIFERTVGTIERAKERVKELNDRGKQAFYTIGNVIKDAFC